MKLVISDPKDGKSFQVEVQKVQESLFLGRKIGEGVDGGSFGAAGYVFKIMGGSDSAGFPMRSNIDGPRRVNVLLASAPGFHAKQKGERAKRRMRGNIISDEIMQINCKVQTPGTKPLAELFPQKEEEKKKEEKK